MADDDETSSIASTFIFSEIEPAHRQRLQELHQELFPVEYSEKFYDNAVQKVGIRGGKLFSSIACQERNGSLEMVGFVLAQFIPSQECDETFNMFDAGGEPQFVFYILTLGVDKSLRRSGLGTMMLKQCVEHASSNPSCGGVYLHVISYNIPALKFYVKNGFKNLVQFPGFYKIHNRAYSSNLCCFYMNGFQPPFFSRIEDTVRVYSDNIIGWIKRLFNIESISPRVKTTELYMDDIELPSDKNQLKKPTKKSSVKYQTNCNMDRTETHAVIIDPV